MKEPTRHVINAGCVVYLQNGLHHREDGPSFITPTGYVEYNRNGKRHREDGPAVMFSNGIGVYYNNGNWVKVVEL